MARERLKAFNEQDATRLLDLINGSAPLQKRESESFNYQRLYRFVLLDSLSDGGAFGRIYQMDGTDTGYDGQIQDPLFIFSSLNQGDAGICQYQDGKFWVIQAPCP